MSLILKAVGTKASDNADFYNNWGENYDADATDLDYRGPAKVADIVSALFKGDREAAVVLDVGCGSGFAAEQLETHGFRHFVGIDGSEVMLESARKTGLYKDLKKCVVGAEPLPVQDFFDLVVVVGALAPGHIPVSGIREIYKTAKSGGYLCLSYGDVQEYTEHRVTLEQELKKMEGEGLWTLIEVIECKEWVRLRKEQTNDYIRGFVYFYKKL